MRPATARVLRQPEPIKAARKLGECGAQVALDLANQRDPQFGAKAYAFIVRHIRSRRAPVSGEDVTLACRDAGIRPHDDRAFGSIYAKAIRAGDIRAVGFCARKRGHGTAGARLYVAGARAKEKRGATNTRRRAG